MAQWIALLRGVNVGGRRLPMAELREELEALGLDDVRTYIQSGNVVFRSEADDPEALGEQIADAVDRRHGFRPQVMVLSADRLREAMAGNPFPEADDEPKSVHLFFLAKPPDADVTPILRETASATERFHLDECVFYLHTPDGFGWSKLATRAEKILGVPATARNWRTVLKLREMIEEAD